MSLTIRRFQLRFAIVSILAATLPLSVSAHELDDLQPGHWYEVPNSRLEALHPCTGANPTPICPAGNFDDLFKAWNGGTMDNVRNRLLVAGGGHNSWYGNGIYAFDVDDMAWTRAANPGAFQPFSNGASTNCVWQGEPASFHTWDFMEYVPEVDTYFYFGCVAPGPVGGTGWRTCALDMSNPDLPGGENSGRWDCNSFPDLPGSFGSGEPRGAHAIYDPVTKDVFIKTGGNNGINRWFVRYDVSENTMTTYDDVYYHKWDTGAAIDPEKRIFFWIGSQDAASTRERSRAMLLDDPDAPSWTPNYSGPVSAMTNSGTLGLAYDSVSRKFVSWTGNGNRSSVYTITVPDDPVNGTWVVEEVRAASGNSVTPSAASPKGTNGRWRYVPAYNVFILVNRVDENVYFYRLSESSSNPNPPPRPEQVSVD